MGWVFELAVSRAGRRSSRRTLEDLDTTVSAGALVVRSRSRARLRLDEPSPPVDRGVTWVVALIAVTSPLVTGHAGPDSYANRGTARSKFPDDIDFRSPLGLASDLVGGKCGSSRDLAKVAQGPLLAVSPGWASQAGRRSAQRRTSAADVPRGGGARTLVRGVHACPFWSGGISRLCEQVACAPTVRRGLSVRRVEARSQATLT